MSNSTFSNVKTKMCRLMYIGCMNEECTFAHTEKEHRAKSFSHAMQGVRFVMPENQPVPPNVSFILSLEDDDDFVPASVSLRGMDQAMMSPHYSMIKTKWLSEEFEKAKVRRGVFFARCSAQKMGAAGEFDMDISE